ncbi:MAG TPA: YceI family protein [Chryseosolibacter sp.]|nr:YceI family protein [Chryseosolibacter sp.]
MKKLNMLLFAVAICSMATAQTTWTIDRVHSKIGFSVVHMAVSEVEGKFNDFEGSVVSKAEDFSNADVTFSAKATSIDTDNERRDNHLRSKDFFEVETYPDITFKGNLTKAGGKYKLKGDLTMHGVTKPVEFDVTYGGSINTGRGQKAGFKLTGQINRRDFGLTWDNKVSTGELVVSDTVDLIVKIEVDKKDTAASAEKKG